MIARTVFPLLGRNPIAWSNRAYEGVPLATGAELDHPHRVEMVERDRARFAFDHCVVDARATAADQPPCLSVGGGEPGAAE
jgi:hypothetical protein